MSRDIFAASFLDAERIAVKYFNVSKEAKSDILITLIMTGE